MKTEWRKSEKQTYLPKEQPELITLPEYRFFTIRGKGNPNDAFFAEYIGVLYSLSYGIKMSPKQGLAPAGYSEYTVYPLEGVWDISQEAKKESSGKLDKSELVFNLMIRQPDFVTEAFARDTIIRIKGKKPHPLLDQVVFETIKEGLCVQMMHIGSYDSEPASFARMEQFAHGQNLTRLSKLHREIYLSDPRTTSADKLRTVLRFQVTSNRQPHTQYP